MRYKTYMRFHVALWVLALFMIASIRGIHAQGNITWEVYIEQDIDDTQQDRLIFINLLTGEIITHDINGDRYTLLENSVLFHDTAEKRLKTLSPTQTEPVIHPFISYHPENYRVDWVVSDDGQSIAWTITNQEPDGTFSTFTYVSGINRSSLREVLRDENREDLRIAPFAFRSGSSKLILDVQPDLLSQYSIYEQHTGLFELDLETGVISPLPDNARCYCGADILENILVRLDDQLNAIRINLESGTSTTIPENRANGFNHAGDMLIAPNQQLAIYATSQVYQYGSPSQFEETIFMLIDLEDGNQRPLNDPIRSVVHPIIWSEDNSSVLFRSEQFPGTWKIAIEDGTITKVANGALLGTITTR